MINGHYPVIGGGEKISGYHNEFNHDKQIIFISRVGSAGYVSYYDKKCYITDLVGAYSIKPIYQFKYVYYILKYLENHIKSYVKKMCAPSLNLTDLQNNLELPIPSIKIQEEIVKKCEYYDEQIERLKKENEEFKNNTYIKDILQIV
jgi:type I restriction enzyme S subunit